MSNTTSSELGAANYVSRYMETDVHFRNFNVSVIVLNGLGSILASFLNALIILTFIKSPSLRTSSNILILSLAISDLGVGFVLEPAYFTFLLAQRWKLHYIGVFSAQIIIKTSPLLINGSSLTILAITIDRYLAVKLHLRYKDLVTTKRSFVAVIIIWTIALSWCILMSTLKSTRDLHIVGLCLHIFFILLTIFLMVKISLKVRDFQAQDLSVLSSINVPRYKKSVHTIYYIIAVFVVCYCVHLFTSIATRILGHYRGIDLLVAQAIANTVVMWNSSLNPVIYFWRIQEMRRAVGGMLRGICCRRKSTLKR